VSYSVNDKEFAAVCALPGPRRYDYFIGKVTDWEEVWSVGEGDGWALMGSDDGQEVVPVWPAAAYAQACCVDEWKDCVPKAILLAEWMEKWIPGMVADKKKVAVFPLPQGKGIVVKPSDLKLDLDEALHVYE